MTTETTGPSYCATCGGWPARPTANGLRCHLCACRDYAAAHPVPMPGNADMLRDLSSIGVPGAAEKLDEMGFHHAGRVVMPNESSSATAATKRPD